MDIIEKALKKEIPLKNRLFITNLTAMIDVIVEGGYREDKSWEGSEGEQLHLINECARKLTENQLKLINNVQI